MKALSKLRLASWRPELVGLIGAAVITRLWGLFQPNAIVFDEVYFKVFAAHYLDHRYYFDIHPPLGKLLLAAFAHLIGLPPGAMLTSNAAALRILPAVAGILLVPLMWGVLRRLGASRPFAGLGALLVLCDNALLVESRFTLIDSMLLLFGVGAVYCYLVARRHTQAGHWIWLVLTGLTAGAAASTKWTGLNALAIIMLLWLWDQRRYAGDWTKRLAELAVIVVLPALLYLTVFWIHFQLLPHTGDGDAFMTPQFQATLVGNPYYSSQAHLSFWSKFLQLNQEMYHANQTLTATHPYGSRWYTWPLELRPIYYWQGPTLADGSQGNTYLLGNPIIWWGVWFAIAIGLSQAWVRQQRLRLSTLAALLLATVAYFINLLPFVPITRVMFLYHYFFSFIYSLIFAILLWNDLATAPNGHQLARPWHRRVFAGVIVLVVLGFCYFAPISYGTPLSPTGLQARMWLPSWR